MKKCIAIILLLFLGCDRYPSHKTAMQLLTATASDIRGAAYEREIVSDGPELRFLKEKQNATIHLSEFIDVLGLFPAERREEFWTDDHWGQPLLVELHDVRVYDSNDHAEWGFVAYDIALVSKGAGRRTRNWNLRREFTLMMFIIYEQQEEQDEASHSINSMRNREDVGEIE